jgi:hypothetical protein
MRPRTLSVPRGRIIQLPLSFACPLKRRPENLFLFAVIHNYAKAVAHTAA